VETNKNLDVKSSGMSWSWATTIVLILLKAFDKINWTWFQVFLPAICGVALRLVVAIILIAFASVVSKYSN